MIPPRMAVLGHAMPRPVRPTMSVRSRGLAAGALALVLVACGDPPPSVQIVQPADGATVTDGSVLVTLEVSGLTVAPAGTMDPGTGHHHLVVDAGLPALGAPIPATPGVYVHMGQAQTEFELTGLASGEHMVIAVVGDGVHVPLNPLVVDTVRFVVE